MVMLRMHCTPSDDDTAGTRRIVAVLAAGLLAAGALTFAGFDALDAAAASPCGPGVEMLDGLPGPIACVHADVPPPGVDVTDHVSTRELLAREGAGPTAHEAAEELGVMSASAAAATSPSVACDGDGTSGYRVQAMYVVEADDPNRFAALEDKLKLWAAGVDDVFNRSAALTGGTRRVRYVTEAGVGSTCEAMILNVTVPAGTLASFGSSISALQALGYDDPQRKYLMWTDINVLCGVGVLYLDDKGSQGNANNGRYPQYARTDTGCWGYGDGSKVASIEAHELLHALGGVQSSAPNTTPWGHCTDESDAMCYADAAGVTMRYVCPREREYLFDCNTDDYFSTSPASGSYLDTHWNSADSRFLIGGGDAASPVTSLGVTVSAVDPAVPGLPSTVEATPTLPIGRTFTSVRWRAGRDDCTFSAPTELRTDVTCNASATGSTEISATVVDSSGATKTATSPLTFATGTARPVTLDLAIASQASPATVCAGIPFPVQAIVTDAATGQPVKGMPVAFTKQTATMAAPATAGSVLTTPSGAAVLTDTAPVVTDYVASTNAPATYATATTIGAQAVPGTCSADLTGSADRSVIYSGETVTVSGTLIRMVEGVEVPVPDASLPVELTTVTDGVSEVTLLGTATTLADGSYTVGVKPTEGGALSVTLEASSAYAAETEQLGDVAVYASTTDLTAAVDKSDVGYGGTVTVTGRLTKISGALTTGETTTAVPSGPIAVKVTAPGKVPVTVGNARTSPDGTFTIDLPLKVSGSMSVSYAGATGLPTASVSLGSVTASTWSTAVTMTTARHRSGYTLRGVVRKSYAGATSAAPGLPVRVMFRPRSTGVPALVRSVPTNAAGSYSTKVHPRVRGTYRVVVVGRAGYKDAASGTHVVTRRAIHRLRHRAAG
jgi:hypothetical protein